MRSSKANCPVQAWAVWFAVELVTHSSTTNCHAFFSLLSRLWRGRKKSAFSCRTTLATAVFALQTDMQECRNRFIWENGADTKWPARQSSAEQSTQHRHQHTDRREMAAQDSVTAKHLALSWAESPTPIASASSRAGSVRLTSAALEGGRQCALWQTLQSGYAGSVTASCGPGAALPEP